MKTLHSLMQPLMQLRQTSEYLRNWLSLGVSDSSGAAKSLGDETKLGKLLKSYPFNDIPVCATQDKKENPDKLPTKLHNCPIHHLKRRKTSRSLIWVVGVVSLTSVMGNRFYNQPKLDVGTAAPQTIRAPYTTSVEDTKTTEEKRKAARTGSVPVLMLDNSITLKIVQDLQQSLDKAEELRHESGLVLFAQTTILSDSTQRYLRQSKEQEWKNLLSYLSKNELNIKTYEPGFGQPESVEKAVNLTFSVAISELQNYRNQSSPQEFSALLESISQARQAYAHGLQLLKQSLVADSKTYYDASLLEISDEAWLSTRKGIVEASKRILNQGIPPGLPPNILEAAIKMQVSSLVPRETEFLATKLLLAVLQPNLTEDKEETKRRAEQAAQAVQPEMVSIREDEVIVREAEIITQAQFVLLDHCGLSRREINWFGLVGFSSLVAGGVAIFWVVEKRVHPRLRRRDHILILLLSLSMPLLGIFKAPYTDLPAIGLLVGSFYNPALGVTVVSLLTGLSVFSINLSWEYLLSGAAAGIVAAWMAGRMRSREELAFGGATVGLTQATVYLIVNLVLSASVASVWPTILTESVLYGLAGLAWSIVALGISPYLERLFDLVTPIRLAELSNPNRPLLKRLATEAPGTFQHTLSVASLAEAAARELHCNVELVRAGTLYHDIGKMHDPLGFIENQMGEPNKHDEINDPKQSAQIIKKHVSEGLVMARKHQLPQAIQDFIPEHQGTLLISYFYFQAQKLAEADNSSVLESDFRYDGPIPQSRETAIVMLADACEAALRSLKDVTPENALAMINKILKARWQDNQLTDSGLTREDLAIIADVFVRVWQQCNHKRIAYPKTTLNS